ncbi:PAS domain-containing protein [Falsiroseomonas oryzae]|uniref:PAS domain-containing protein n=1 Tax=Falsiroseomonas oryzae TaxID=2766473 RepID=UPI0022EABF59|nr:PAS domain-containing protein [Roseomonas sp. MO-31]
MDSSHARAATETAKPTGPVAAGRPQPALPGPEAAAELAVIYDTAPVGLCVLDREGRFLRINARLAAINGLPVAAHIGRRVRDILPDLAEAGEALLQRIFESGQPILGVELEGETPAQPGVRRAWVEDWSPVRDAGGRVVAVNVVAREVTEERAAARALREGEARLATLLDALPVGVGLVDTAGRLVVANREMRRFVSEVIPSRDPAQHDRWRGFHADGSRIAPTEFPASRALRGESVLPGIDFIHVAADGQEVWTRVGAVPLRDEAGRVTGAVSVVTDIAAEKAAKERQALLMREVNHRAKNALTVVQAALRLTPRTDPGAYARAVEGRVAALARAHTLLADGAWQGGALHPLLEAELAAFLPAQRVGTGSGVQPPPAVTLDGPPLQLAPTATQALAMALHELATNAVKYGALSCLGGVVAVTWTIAAEEKLLRLRWAERGGPPLHGPPDRRGFGSRVLEATIRDQLGGRVRRSWEAAGLVCELEIPLARAEASEAPADEARPAG